LSISWKQDECDFKLQFADLPIYTEVTKQIKVHQTHQTNHQKSMDPSVLKAVADELHSWDSEDNNQQGTQRDVSPQKENNEKRERRIQLSPSRMNTPLSSPLLEREEESLEEKPPYYRAIITLQQIIELKSPRDKLGCILQTFKDTIQCVSDYWDPLDREPVVGADDLVPIFAYVILKAQIPKLFSEMNFIWEFANDMEMNGKYGYGFATFQIGVEAVARLDDSIYNEKDAKTTDVQTTSPTTNNNTERLDGIIEKRQILVNRRASQISHVKDEFDDDF